jgi:hypothetical protein
MNKKNLKSALMTAVLLLFLSPSAQAISKVHPWNDLKWGTPYQTAAVTEYIFDFQSKSAHSQKHGSRLGFDTSVGTLNGTPRDLHNLMTYFDSPEAGDINTSISPSHNAKTLLPLTEPRTMILFGISLITVGAYIRKFSNRQQY